MRKNNKRQKLKLSNLKRRSAGSAQVEQDPHVTGHASLTPVYAHLRVVLFLPAHSQLFEDIVPGSISNRIRPPKSAQEPEGEDGAFESLLGVGADVVTVTGDGVWLPVVYKSLSSNKSLTNLFLFGSTSSKSYDIAKFKR